MDKQEPRENVSNTQIVCYAPTLITTNGIWRGDNPLAFSLPLFILQLTLVVLTTRTLVFVLKPLRQPRVIAEIIGGVLLGPSGLGRNEKFAKVVFPLRSVTVLETMANVGLLYFLFLVGVEMDLSVIKRTGRKAMAIALASMVLPFIVGMVTSFILKNSISQNVPQGTFLLFLGVSLSVTAFPVLARILAELKLLNTELGRVAMSSAIVNDMCAWILLALAIALVENKGNPLASLWVVLSGTAFVLFCLFAVRPAIRWIIRQTPEGEAVSEFHICMILTGVMVSGFITDAIGIHSIFGAFVFGLVIPNGHLGASLIEKLEDFVAGLLLPLFFAISGLRTDVRAINDASRWVPLLLVIVLACVGKVVGTLVVALFYKMPFREGFSLGMLMNTKGLIEMIVLNVGRDQNVLDEESFAILVIMAVIMTAMITPIVTVAYRPSRRFVPYKRRTLQRLKPDSELRILACIHTPRNVPTTINLVEASQPTKKSPIFVYALHLVELTGRASAMLIVHNTQKGDDGSSSSPINRAQANSDHIANAFQNYEHHFGNVSIQPLTAISPYSTMHEDICNLAEDKRAAIIIVPFHKQQTVDGGMEPTNPAFRTVNQNVLANAPCSVGILIDRGLGGTTRISASNISHHIAVLFFGGPDDREAMSYAWRMSGHPGINLTVMRFIAGDDVAEPSPLPGYESKTLTVFTDNERERQIDEEFLNEFRLNYVNDESIVYLEKVVNNGEETVAAIRGMDNVHDLYIVGRGQGRISPLTAGLTEWSECPELGAIGDVLASSDFAATVSVLVIQQYVGQTPTEGVGTPDSPTQHMDAFNTWMAHQGIQQRGDVSPNGFHSRWNSTGGLAA
ncbi:hypothetical protein MRB53_013658 [Persea americana]|uniref:Uncharacterized protein n=1 Tax=Persea americana TaxID=3435 RepID=A0ACC2K8N0_PERAE|nr:hypothetical protein MRB53_013658 [Persea americana]